MAMPRGHTPRPYVTPASDPQQTPTPHHARRTSPLRPLNSATEFFTRDTCFACNGTRYERRSYSGCRKCGRKFTAETMANHTIHSDWNHATLPCGDSAKKYQHTEWMEVPCTMCSQKDAQGTYVNMAGPGYLMRPINLRQLMLYFMQHRDFQEWLLNLVAETFIAEEDEETTQEHIAATIQRTGGYGQSEPTAPPPHLTTGAPAPYYHTPHTSHTPQERVTPQVGPHLAPLASDAPPPPQTPPDDMPSRF